MCLITEQSEAIVLDKAKTVYKALRRDLHSPCQEEFLWEPNKLYTQRLYPKRIDTRKEYKGDYTFADSRCMKVYDHKGIFTCISIGFHSAKTRSRVTNLYSFTEIHRFRIPAGAKVFYDSTGLIVSNKIMLVK